MSNKVHIPNVRPSSRSTSTRPLLLALCTAIATLTVYACHYYLDYATKNPSAHIHRIPLNAQQIVKQCAALKAIPGPPDKFNTREVSDRFEPGTRPTWIRNASLWTGARNGTEIVYGDLLLDGGIIKGLGYIPQSRISNIGNLITVEANGAWVTPGLVDLHSHVGVISAPFTSGAFDVNSAKGPILPWLRSIDALNTHDDAFQLAIAGGVTSAQVLPGSGNAIGGQGFMVKLRKTSERSPTSMIIEPPHTLIDSESDLSQSLRWRHMKQACGENLITYGNRMDSIWSLRSAYNEARKVKQAQDDFCAKVDGGLWNELEGQSFPDSYQWEMLVDVLRGRVKISNHCYEAVDLDDIVRLTNEFQFPIASFHHASEAWLVPQVLKRTWGGTPAIAIFATNHRYKRESYRGSEFAPRVLADAGIPVVMKSDHPVINSRYLLHEAQQAHYYGLEPRLALASVTSTPATAAGLSHRIGILRESADADVVMWDSHPLHIGATPKKVWIDGVLQIGGEDNIIIGKGKDDEKWQEVPEVPKWEKETDKAVKYEGLSPLLGKKEKGRVAFSNVKEVWVRGEGGIKEVLSATAAEKGTVVVIDQGQISCVGKPAVCLTGNEGAVLDLHNGSISPGFSTFGSPLGIEEIMGEPSTGDGQLFDPFVADVPTIMGDTAGLVRAVDTLQFGTRNALVSYRAGVTYATSYFGRITHFGAASPIIAGLSTTFRTGANNALEEGAVIKPITALHVMIHHAAPTSRAASVSLSSEIAALRRLLLNAEDDRTETGRWFQRAAEGAIPLVVTVGSADIMATLLNLKEEIEDLRGSTMHLVFARATEAHLLAEEIGKAKVSVILNPSRPFPGAWDDRRILAGPPLTNETALTTLLKHNVAVALGVVEGWQAGNTRFDVAWAELESNGRIDRRSAHALATTNLEKILGVEGWVGEDGDLAVYAGGSADELASKVVAVASPRRGLVELF